MRCEDCHGLGWLPLFVIRREDAPPTLARLLPCPACQGSGIASCCEGAVGCAGDTTNSGRTVGVSP